MPRAVKLFRNGRSQAVRLPAEFRFDAQEVWIRKDPATGDVILSARPDSWDEFFRLRDQVPTEERQQFHPRSSSLPVERADPFEGWKE
jgi:antitoxin VapB